MSSDAWVCSPALEDGPDLLVGLHVARLDEGRPDRLGERPNASLDQALDRREADLGALRRGAPARSPRRSSGRWRPRRSARSCRRAAPSVSSSGCVGRRGQHTCAIRLRYARCAPSTPAALREALRGDPGAAARSRRRDRVGRQGGPGFGRRRQRARTARDGLPDRDQHLAGQPSVAVEARREARQRDPARAVPVGTLGIGGLRGSGLPGSAAVRALVGGRQDRVRRPASADATRRRPRPGPARPR